MVSAAMSQISTHPRLLVWAQSKVQRPWALFRQTTVNEIQVARRFDGISLDAGIHIAIKMVQLSQFHPSYIQCWAVEPSELVAGYRASSPRASEGPQEWSGHI